MNTLARIAAVCAVFTIPPAAAVPTALLPFGTAPAWPGALCRRGENSPPRRGWR
jgi:hypothetical protein